ncbi:hypothetical protein DFJ63DRAFT_315648 [Scheffersomyces coipomensis]|uniref:uncharacterized protein n=1 Tax=Scheffersomyces coipomensis TaxID=1788519 RepID=UPI00315D7896
MSDATSLPQISVLPHEIIQTITSFLTIDDLKNVAQINHLFNYYANEVIYRHISIIDDGYKVNNIHHTKCHIQNIDNLTKSLTEKVFHHIRSIQINCSSSLELNNYESLYQRLYELSTNIHTGYQIKFLNYDYSSIQKYQSLNQYILNKSITFNSDTCCYDASNTRLNAFSNLMALQLEDINQINMSSSLDQMSIILSHYNTFPDHHLNWNMFNNLYELYLNTHASTVMLLDYTHRTSVTPLNHLLSFAVTFSHSNGSHMTVSNLQTFINFASLTKLELRLDCSLSGCSCITTFIQDLNQVEMPDLNQLIINNIKSDCRSAPQYKALIHHAPFHLNSIKSLNISINSFEFSNVAVSTSKFFKNLTPLTQIEELIIPDILSSNWLNNRFEALLTSCECIHCNNTRRLFNHLSYYDAENNYRHDFKSQPNLENTSTTTILKNHSNIRFLQYLISLLKLQFHSNVNFSLLENNNYIENDTLVPFKSLFRHCYLNKVATEIKQNLPLIQTLNLGGIVITNL